MQRLQDEASLGNAWMWQGQVRAGDQRVAVQKQVEIECARAPVFAPYATLRLFDRLQCVEQCRRRERRVELRNRIKVVRLALVCLPRLLQRRVAIDRRDGDDLCARQAGERIDSALQLHRRLADVAAKTDPGIHERCALRVSSCAGGGACGQRRRQAAVWLPDRAT